MVCHCGLMVLSWKFHGAFSDCMVLPWLCMVLSGAVVDHLLPLVSMVLSQTFMQLPWTPMVSPWCFHSVFIDSRAFHIR